MLPPQPVEPDLAGYEILVAVGGGIAAYKVCEVVSQLVQHGAGVTVAMTAAAQKFVGPLTFQALTARPVLTDLWTVADSADIQHIVLTDRANVFLVAPATANLLGKIACGIADEVVSTLAISAGCPLLLAPAMNPRMWSNPAVQRNIQVLRERGAILVGPGSGWLACRSVGEGRMADAQEIYLAAVTALKSTPRRS